MIEDKPNDGNIKRPARRSEPRLARRITEDYLHNSGLYYLQRFAAGSEHFRRVMMRKVDRSCRDHPDQDRATCEGLVGALVEKFLRAGLLNDEAYLTGSIASHRRRGLSSRAIAAKLAAKGVPAENIRSALKTDNSAQDDLAAALRQARRRRIGPFARPDGNISDQKAFATMARAGFDYETASRALQMKTADAEDIIATSGDR